MVDLDRGDLSRVRHEELHEGRIAQLTFVVIGKALVERAAYPLRDSALDLPLDHQRVDDTPAVVDHDVLEHLEAERLGVDVNVSGVTPRCPRRTGWAVVAGRLESRLLALRQRRPGPRSGCELRRGLGAAAEGIAHGV